MWRTTLSGMLFALVGIQIFKKLCNVAKSCGFQLAFERRDSLSVAGGLSVGLDIVSLVENSVSSFEIFRR
jgi:hypothetical protein